jgi:hypothetical protein
MSQSASSPLILNAEQEHARLRLVIVLLIGLLFVLFFFLIGALLQRAPGMLASFSLPLTCLLSTVVALALAWFIEQRLKQVWTSGYRLLLDEAAIVVEQPESDPIHLNKGGTINHLAWYFKLSGYKRGGRERHVPEKWLCLACQLQQEERLLIVYAYIPPAKADELVQSFAGLFRFQKLNPAEVYRTGLTSRLQPPGRPESIPAQVLSGKDGRYWLAEQRRWREGLELPPKEFMIFLDYLQSGR